jgi:hypothetical protein
VSYRAADRHTEEVDLLDSLDAWLKVSGPMNTDELFLHCHKSRRKHGLSDLIQQERLVDIAKLIGKANIHADLQ